MATQKSNIVRLRLTDLEKADWQAAAGGARRMSEWIRAVCNAEAEKARNPLLMVEGPEIAYDTLNPPPATEIPNAVPKLVKLAIASEQDASLSTPDRVHRESRSLPATGARRADSSAGDGKASGAGGSATCPRWMHHRSGTYCGSCKKVIK